MSAYIWESLTTTQTAKQKQRLTHLPICCVCIPEAAMEAIMGTMYTPKIEGMNTFPIGIEM
jgi:hypothetical protein